MEWSEEFYQRTKELMLAGGVPEEDQRTSDWVYLLPLENIRSVLILGGGWGALASRLNRFCDKITIIETDREKVNSLLKRKKEQILDNVSIEYANFAGALPDIKDEFDMVVLHEAKWKHRISINKLLPWLKERLKENGYLCCFGGNKLYFNYRRLLNKYGFNSVSSFMPLPSHKGIPLFYLPLDNKKVMLYFFEKIFPLFEMASPETKKNYAFQYRLAKLAVKIGLFLKLEWLAKYFAPGYFFIARNKQCCQI